MNHHLTRQSDVNVGDALVQSPFASVWACVRACGRASMCVCVSVCVYVCLPVSQISRLQPVLLA